MFPRVPRLLLLSCAALLVVPATGQAASHRVTSPTVSSVKPLRLAVGQRLTITGKGFLKGRNKTTVVFKRDRRRAIFVRAERATTTRLVVKVPTTLLSTFSVANGLPVATRFRLRVLARRFGKSYTKTSRSPVVLPPGAVTTPSTPGPVAPADCDKDGVPNTADTDDDDDGLPDTLEATLRTDACSADSDRDGVSDAFEYESALDLNSRAIPFPGKRPYPNPLDGSDANVDFDQDGLPQRVEFLLWQSKGGRLPLSYSDGDQDTNVTSARTATPGNPDLQRLDLDHDGYLTDDEKDADGDLLGNWDEYGGRMQPAWWTATYTNEKQYLGGNGASVLSTTSLVDPDTDGDGVLDGLDDQDHDGYANRDELDRDATGLWVHAYNPCLPNPYSRTCSLHPPIDNAWAPFGSPLPPKPGPDDPPAELPWSG